MIKIAMISAAVAIFSLVLLISLFSCSPKEKQLLNSRSEALHRSLLTQLSWPVITALSVLVLPLMTWGFRHRLTHAISQAGLLGWNCAQFFSMQMLLGVVASVFLLFIFVITDSFGSFKPFILLLIFIPLVGGLPRFWLRTQRHQRYVEIEKGLPFFLDMVNIGLEAGMNLQTAVQLALDHLHSGPIKEEWQQTIFEIRSGIPRADAFRRMSLRVELVCIRQMVIAFIQGESMGLSLGKSIAEFSHQQDQYRLLRSEKLALQAPIKMLFPLAFCIFPCTFLVLGFPVVAQLLGLE